MLKGKSILAIIPARGGSKGVPLKNIYPLMGRPLLTYVGDVIQEAGYFDSAIVSTDHPEIEKVALSVGLKVPFYRPLSLSGDRIGDIDVLIHALTEVERLDQRHYDIVVMLQPTSPLRKTIHVTTAILKLIDEDWDAVWTISPTDLKYHPLKQLALSSDNNLDYFDSRGGSIVARQQLGQVYHRNGCAYVFKRDCILNEKKILAKKTTGLVIDDEMLSIDTVEDFNKTEIILKTRIKNIDDERLSKL